MSMLSPLLNQVILHRLGWTLLHSLWQGAFIGATYALLSVGLKRQSSQARYLSGCLALALLAAAPMFTFMSISEEARVPGETTRRGTALVQPGFSAVASTQTPVAVNAIPSWLTAAAEQLSQVTPWLAIIWSLGVLIFAARLARGFWWIQRLQAAGSEPVERESLVTLNQLRARFGISRPVRLCKSALVEVPTVFGWLRPVILLPTSSVLGLTPGQLEAILAHELAHVRRFDYLVNACQCLLETLLFYHPIIWWISRQVREEREHCCDDLVVEICGNKLAYARALAAMEQLRGAAPDFAFAANGGSLLSRIRRMLGATTEDGTSPARRAGGLALIGVGLLLVIGGVLLHLALPRYRAVARVKVEATPPAGAATPMSYDPYFLQTEMEIIQSEPVLRTVNDELALNKKWAQKLKPEGEIENAHSLAMLRPMLSIRPVRNTSFLEIGVYDQNPGEAKDIANALVRSYREYHFRQRMEAKLTNLNELEKRAAEQQQRIGQAQDHVDELRSSLGILDGTTDTNGLSSAGQTLRQLESLRIDTEAQLVREKTLLDGLKKLPFDQLTQVLPTAAPDTLLVALLDKTVAAEQELVIAEKNFGPEHPEVIKTQAQVKDLQRKTHQRVEGILIGLDERVNSLRSGLENLKAESERLRSMEADRSLKSRPFFKAKRELEDLERIGDSLNMSVASARLQLMTPVNSMVEIMELAEAPTRPVFPNRAKATACIILGLLLNLLGFNILRRPSGLSLQPAAAPA